MNMDKIANMLFPVIVSAIAWLLTSMASIQSDLINIKSKMPILITEQGVPTDSPISAEHRGKLKEELRQQISELNVRIRILEEHDMQRKVK
jgi:predicted amino acid-binding ACT domain protein